MSNEQFRQELAKLSFDVYEIAYVLNKIFYSDTHKMNIKVIDKKKSDLFKLRNKLKTQQGKNIVDEYIEYYDNISEGYWEDIDTSREGT